MTVIYLSLNLKAQAILIWRS
jgi:hypothetical protein